MSEENEKSFRILPKGVIAWVLVLFDKISILFVHLRIHPNALTYVGFAAGAAVGFFFLLHRPFWAAVFIVLCGLLDILDGKVAINANRKSLFGAILDSSLDRYSEFFMYFGLAYHFRTHWALWVVFFALLGSTMVSYSRARAEGLGIICALGIMQRAERLVLLFLGAVLGLIFGIYDPAMITALIIIALLSNITAFQRIFSVRRYEKLKSGPPPES